MSKSSVKSRVSCFLEWRKTIKIPVAKKKVNQEEEEVK